MFFLVPSPLLGHKAAGEIKSPDPLAQGICIRMLSPALPAIVADAR